MANHRRNIKTKTQKKALPPGEWGRAFKLEDMVPQQYFYRAIVIH